MQQIKDWLSMGYVYLSIQITVNESNIVEHIDTFHVGLLLWWTWKNLYNVPKQVMGITVLKWCENDDGYKIDKYVLNDS